VSVFSIDTSALIGAHYELYPPRTFPGLWRQIEALIASAELVATEEVLHELERQDDELLAWVRNQAGFFVPMDPQIEAAVRRVVAVTNFVRGTSTDNFADPFVIALAIARNATVVSRENPGGPSKPKIPYVCRILGVDHQTLEEFVNGQGWSFT
jgi:uncharacterized protein DUF4411